MRLSQHSGSHFPIIFEGHHLVGIMWLQDTEEGLCPGQNGGSPSRKEMKGMEEDSPPQAVTSLKVPRASYTTSLLPVEFVASPSSFFSTSSSFFSSSSSFEIGSYITHFGLKPAMYSYAWS